MFSIWHEVFVTWQSFWKQGRSISEMSFYGKIVTINEHTVFFLKKKSESKHHSCYCKLELLWRICYA